MKPDDFRYALENTKVVMPPQKRLETFGTTVLNYHLTTEEMDSVNRMRVREGRIHAHKPELLTPDKFAKLLLEGFGEKAERYADAVSEFASQIAVLKYGFSFRKDETRKYDVTGALAEVTARVQEEVQRKNDPLDLLLHPKHLHHPPSPSSQAWLGHWQRLCIYWQHQQSMGQLISLPVRDTLNSFLS